METREGQRGGETPSTDERLAWLAEMCRLGPLALDLFELVAGVGGEPNAPPRWWTVSSVAARLHVDDATVIAQLVPGAPLIDWGLVRTAPPPSSRVPAEARVAVNERIARFLWSCRVRPAEYRSAE
jgi:hypothetical protein